jgi:CDGSH-type Zn-finger protein
MSSAKIVIKDNGSIKVTGDVELIDGKGDIYDKSEAFSLCRCGLSKNKPFCDGSHRGNFHSCVRASSSNE